MINMCPLAGSISPSIINSFLCKVWRMVWFNNHDNIAWYIVSTNVCDSSVWFMNTTQSNNTSFYIWIHIVLEKIIWSIKYRNNIISRDPPWSTKIAATAFMIREVEIYSMQQPNFHSSFGSNLTLRRFVRHDLSVNNWLLSFAITLYNPCVFVCDIAVYRLDFCW